MTPDQCTTICKECKKQWVTTLSTDKPSEIKINKQTLTPDTDRFSGTWFSFLYKENKTINSTEIKQRKEQIDAILEYCKKRIKEHGRKWEFENLSYRFNGKQIIIKIPNVKKITSIDYNNQSYTITPRKFGKYSIETPEGFNREDCPVWNEDSNFIRRIIRQLPQEEYTTELTFNEENTEATLWFQPKT